MLLIKNARVIDPSQKLDELKDIWVEDEKIAELGAPGSLDGKLKNNPQSKTLDAKGLVLTPGFIDLHVHLRDFGQEYKETVETGLRAAVWGGFTSVACMANSEPVNDNALLTRRILEKSCEVALSRVFPIGAVTRGLKGEELAEIGLMAEAGICAVSDDGMPIMNSNLMRKAMEYAKTFNLPIISHAEDLNLSKGTQMNEGPTSSLLGFRGNPNASEEIMVAREIALARLTGAKVHIAHLSTREALVLVKNAKKEGLPISAEVTPHHLVLNDEFIVTGKHACAHRHPPADYKMAPPLRSLLDQEALVEALNSGLIDIIASDHAPHGCVDKEVEFEMVANGILGLQTTVPLVLELVHQKKLTLHRMIEALTSGPAQVLGNSKIGNLRIGSHADFTIMNLDQEWTLNPSDVVSKSLNSPFLGRKFKGKVTHTIVGGQIKYGK